MKQNIKRIWNSSKRIVEKFMIKNNFSPAAKINKYLTLILSSITFTICILGLSIISISYCLTGGNSDSSKLNYKTN